MLLVPSLFGGVSISFKSAEVVTVVPVQRPEPDLSTLFARKSCARNYEQMQNEVGALSPAAPGRTRPQSDDQCLWYAFRSMVPAVRHQYLTHGLVSKRFALCEVQLRSENAQQVSLACIKPS
jgi:hypothetical protein